MSNISSNRALLLCAQTADDAAKLVAVTTVLRNIEAHKDKQNSEPVRRMVRRLLMSLPVTEEVEILFSRLAELQRNLRHWKSTKAERMAAKIARRSVPAFEKVAPKDAFSGTQDVQKDTYRDPRKTYMPPDIRTDMRVTAPPQNDVTNDVTNDTNPIEPPPAPAVPIITQCAWCKGLQECQHVATEGYLCRWCYATYEEREASDSARKKEKEAGRLIEPRVSLRPPPVQAAPQFVPPRRDETAQRQRQVEKAEEARAANARREQEKADRARSLANILNESFEVQKKLLGI